MTKNNTPKKRKISCSIERGVTAYLPPRIHQMFIADCYNNYRSKSDKLVEITTAHYKVMAEIEQKNLIQLFESLKPDQIKSKKGFISKHD